MRAPASPSSAARSLPPAPPQQRLQPAPHVAVRGSGFRASLESEPRSLRSGVLHRSPFVLRSSAADIPSRRLAWDTPRMDMPEVQYARSGGVAVAYQVVGEGPPTLLFSPPTTARTRSGSSRVRSRSSVACRSLRGSRVQSARHGPLGPTAANDADHGWTTSAPSSTPSAVSAPRRSARVCPRRVRALCGHIPRTLRSTGPLHAVRECGPVRLPPVGEVEEETLEWMREVRSSWGDRDFLESLARGFFDSELVDEDGFLDWFVRERRLANTPASAEFLRMAMETDMRGVWGSIRVSTLVLHRDQGREDARYIADHIPHATLVELGGKGRWLYTDDVADAVLSFLRGETVPWVPDSVLATVLFTDLWARPSGRRSWGPRVAGGPRRSTTPMFAVSLPVTAGLRWTPPETASSADSTDRPGNRMRQAILEGASRARPPGPCRHPYRRVRVAREKIAGISVVTGSRISSLAASGEVLVSSTVKDLVAGSGFSFEERGEHELKGVQALGGCTRSSEAVGGFSSGHDGGTRSRCC